MILIRSGLPMSCTSGRVLLLGNVSQMPVAGCGGKGFARNGFGGTLLYCDNHIRDKFTPVPAEKGATAEAPGAEKHVPKSVVADQLTHGESKIQCGDCTLQTGICMGDASRHHNSRYLKRVRLLRQRSRHPIRTGGETDKRNRRLGPRIRDAVDGSGFPSGRQKNRRAPEQVTERSDRIDSEEGVAWKDLKTTIDKKQGYATFLTNKSSLRSTDDGSKSVEIDCLRKCATREKKFAEADHRPVRDILLATTGVAVDGVRNKSSLPKFLQKPQPRGDEVPMSPGNESAKRELEGGQWRNVAAAMSNALSG